MTDVNIQHLREMLMNYRWDSQDGYPGYKGDGEWQFATTHIRVSPEQLNALFELAGIEPDKIVPRGNCGSCRFAVDGHERGYVEPCLTCERPKMSNYEPISAPPKR